MQRLTASAAVLALALAGCDRDLTRPEGPPQDLRSVPRAAIIPGEMIDLGTLGGNWSEARGINEAGQVVGVAYTAAQQQRAFLWTEADGMRDLGFLSDVYPYSHANDINDHGQVVGWTYVHHGGVTGQQRSMIWSETEGMRELPLLSEGCASPWSEAVAINNRGEVVGWSTGTDCYQYAVYWDASGNVTDLGAGQGSFATDINDAGRVVGFNSSSSQLGFTWTRGGGLQELPRYSGWPAYPYGINRSAQIAGGSGAVGGVMWPSPEDDPVPLTPLAPGFVSQGEAIDQQGRIAGWSYASCEGGVCQRATYWSTPEQPLHLGVLEGGRNSYAFDLNDGGQVVGYSEAGFARRAFLYQVPGTSPNTPPHFIHPGDGARYQFTAGHESSFGVRAADLNPDDVVTLGVENLPAGASFPIPAPANPVEAHFRWTPTEQQAGEHRVTFRATDDRGAATEVTVTIEVTPGEEPPPPPQCTDPNREIVAWNGSEPGRISLGTAEVQVVVFDVEQHFPPHNPRATPDDLRLGSAWESATPALGYVVRDVNQDGRRDVRLTFHTARLVDEGNLSLGTHELILWGRDPVTEERYCGRTTVDVVP